VVFGGEGAARSREVAPPRSKELADVLNEWDVVFLPGLGAPERITMSALAPWTEHELPGVRFYSGTATYSTTFKAPDSWFQPGRRLLLNLGDVRDVAEVFLNGKRLGVVWKPSYQVDATSALRAGENRLEIRVTNEWTNRILGDRLAQPEERILGDTGPQFGRGPREPEISGLLGPVRILALE
jgi:Glycosyl hydrolases family 2, sugar binding domain